MPKEPKKFLIKGVDEIKGDAPVVSDEFIDKRPEGDYTGQTLEVQSETKLEQDLGTGEAFVLRTYEFRANPEVFLRENPTPQDIFLAHQKGIAGMLWQDGLSPAIEVAPRIIFSKDGSKYMIIVGARPSVGQVLLETPHTLSQIINENGRRENRDTLQRSVPVSPRKKKKTSRTA